MTAAAARFVIPFADEVNLAAAFFWVKPHTNAAPICLVWTAILMAGAQNHRLPGCLPCDQYNTLAKPPKRCDASAVTERQEESFE